MQRSINTQITGVPHQPGTVPVSREGTATAILKATTSNPYCNFIPGRKVKASFNVKYEGVLGTFCLFEGIGLHCKLLALHNGVSCHGALLL